MAWIASFPLITGLQIHQRYIRMVGPELIGEFDSITGRGVAGEWECVFRFKSKFNGDHTGSTNHVLHNVAVSRERSGKWPSFNTEPRFSTDTFGRTCSQQNKLRTGRAPLPRGGTDLVVPSHAWLGKAPSSEVWCKPN
jgi:hypothetical protein